MRRTGYSLSIALALLSASSLKAESLESVLRHMDEAAASFKSLTAHIRNVKHTAIVNDNALDEGAIFVKRVKPRLSVLLIEFTVPDTYYVSISEKKAEIYRPKLATLEEYDITRYGALKEQLWLLSFGAAGRDLSAHYRIGLKGTETVAGKPAVELELVPKSADLLKHVPRIEMWVSTAIWQAVQQKIYDPTPGDYRLSTYTDIKLNVPIPDSRLKIRLASGTRKIQPQK